MNLGDKLKHLRNRKRMSLQELTDDLNKHYTNEDGKNFFAKGKLSKWETGNVDPATSALVKVAKYYNVSLDYLTGLEDTNDRYPVVEVPVFSNVNKQSTLESEEHLRFYNYIAESDKYSKDELFYLELKDTLYLVNKDIEIKNGELGLYFVPDSHIAKLGRIYRYGKQSVFVSENEHPHIYGNDGVKEIGIIISKVVSIL
ncbi:XRE family transcriptional regulator [Staphylococcus casei]|uniref:helix-turn-helix domain-containing protein n=1 Tax=Staphylococcus TaxID=1279 RepID=UPI000853D52E|nr:helix-turn-helix transcriptional regulator [Staphylococcus casei]OEL03781.1 hypothetical protein AST12_03435 [Staphylococcus succinus]PNZ57778.1 XRE family transcriptional regulator [Staphylococcus casei]WJE85802.1 helix-turn-helix transcriptional regulator [Staphylococcus casei]